jgi:cell division septation protein DedD
MIRVLVIFLWLCLTPAWAISYTVQLFASSDETKASQFQAQLAAQGYKAYLLRVPTAQGQVYRVRVGAFGNRAAAALFAQVMPGVDGSTPSPALAEGGVPQDFIPLQPALLGQYDLATMLVQVFPWSGVDTSEVILQESGDEPSQAVTVEGPRPRPSSPEAEPEFLTTPQEPSVPQTPAAEPGMAIRVQPKDASEQAHYRIGNLEFDAWQAAPLDDGWMLRVRSFPVWPEDWPNTPEAEREQYRETVLANLSGDLDVTPQQLEPFVFELDGEAPFVVLVERFNPETQQIERLRSIGQPRPNQENLGLTLYGPTTFFGETVAIPVVTMVELSDQTQAPDEVFGNGWQASREDAFATLTVGDQTWRAAVGQPVWVSGDLLISLYNDQLLLYQIQQP